MAKGPVSFCNLNNFKFTRIFIEDFLSALFRFPYVQSRIGKYEYEDKKILCIAASDFYRKVRLKTGFSTVVSCIEREFLNKRTTFSLLSIVTKGNAEKSFCGNIRSSGKGTRNSV